MLVTVDNFAACMERIRRAAERTVDTETSGLLPWTGDRVVGVSIICDNDPEEKGMYFPCRHVSGNIGKTRYAQLIELLSQTHLDDGTEITYVYFNASFDIQMLAQDGLTPPENLQEVKLMAHLMNENEPAFKLKVLGDKYLGEGASKESRDLDMLLAENGLAKNEMWKLPPHQVESYAVQDVVLTRGLRDMYTAPLKRWKMYDLWLETNEFQVGVMDSEMYGMLLDRQMLERYTEEADVKREEARGVVQKLAWEVLGRFPSKTLAKWEDVNLNSHPQMQRWLGLKSTAAEFLDERMDHPGVPELQLFRAWNRVRQNYYRKFAELMDPRTGRLHPNLNTIGTISGRLSAANPPLHAIPRSEDGPVQGQDSPWKVKDPFIADEGMETVEVDWSQAELRVVCHYGRERRMGEKLTRGADIHTETASELQMPRPTAKTINFSVVYGIGWKTLSERLKITGAQAKMYLAKYHGNYPGFKALYRQAQAKAEKQGYIRLYTGRMRHFNDDVKAPSHKASSNLVQGAVAEMARIAMMRVRRELRSEGVRIQLQVHDSLILQVPKPVLRKVVPHIIHIMNDQPWCSIPHKVDAKVGPSWGLAQKWKE